MIFVSHYPLCFGNYLKIMKKYLLVFLGAGLFLGSCSKNDDPQVAEELEETIPTPEVEIDVTVQNFMWQTMNTYYYWQGDVVDLGDDRFTSNDDYISFLE